MINLALAALVMMQPDSEAPPQSAGQIPVLSCRLATRAGTVFEFVAAPQAIDGRPGFRLNINGNVPTELSDSQAIFSKETKGEWDFGLYRSGKPIALVTIGSKGLSRNITIFDHPHDQSGIPVAFGFCTDQQLADNVSNDKKRPNFLNAQNWIDGCGYISQSQANLVPFRRKVSNRDGAAWSIIELLDGKELTGPGGSPVMTTIPSRYGINYVRVMGLNAANGNVRGVLVAYGDPERMLGSEIVRLQHHQLSNEGIYGICSVSVRKVDGNIAIGS